MEDSKLLLYIVLGAIYFISKFLKAKKNKAQVSDGFDEESSSESSTGPSFEEVLQEMTGQKTVLETPVVEVTKKEPIIQNTLASRNRNTNTENTLEKDIEDFKTIDRQESIVRKKPKYGRSDGYTIEEDEDSNVASDIIALLSDSEGAKRVIIANEILQRKY